MVNSVLLRYAVCLAALIAAVAMAQLLQNALPGLFVFLFLAAVLVSSRLRAKGPAVLAILASSLAVAYFLPPAGSLAVDRTGLPLLLSFIGCALLVTWLTLD